MMQQKIVLVEDDADLGSVLKQYLEASGFAVTWYQQPKEVLENIDGSKPKLFILDVMLPEMSGFELCEKIRKNSSAPFLFLTAKGQSIDRILGLKLGAADYITKACEPEELILRINNILKRSSESTTNEIKIGNYKFLPAEFQLNYENQNFQLTEKESELLQFLVLHNHKLVSRSELLETLWGADDYFMGRSLDVFMSRLRKYFRFDASIKFDAVRGIGYKVEFPG